MVQNEQRSLESARDPIDIGRCQGRIEAYKRIFNLRQELQNVMGQEKSRK